MLPCIPNVPKSSSHTRREDRCLEPSKARTSRSVCGSKYLFTRYLEDYRFICPNFMVNVGHYTPYMEHVGMRKGNATFRFHSHLGGEMWLFMICSLQKEFPHLYIPNHRKFGLINGTPEVRRNKNCQNNKHQVSNEKYPGWLGYIGDYTTQLYRDYNKPL